MFYQHRFSKPVNKAKVQYSVTLVLILAVSSIVSAKEPYPSTLDDYVTLYQIKSYELFRHDSAEYERRLERGRKAIRRMKKHGGRSAEAATKHWFETVVYSGDTADNLPGLPAVAYLKDVDAATLAKREAEKNTVASSDQPTSVAAESPANTNPVAEVTEAVSETNDNANGMAAAVAALRKAMSSTDSEPLAADESANIDDAKGALSATTSVLQGLASTVFGSIENAATTEDAGDDSGESGEGDAEPFPSIQPASPFDKFARSQDVEQVADGEGNDTQSASVDVNSRINDYNAALTAVQGEVLVALGGDGNELNAVVEKIESLAETRSGIQAEIDLTSQSTQAIQAATDLHPIVKELHKGIFKFPKSPDGLPFKKAVNMLERLEDVELQLKELSTK